MALCLSFAKFVVVYILLEVLMFLCVMLCFLVSRAVVCLIIVYEILVVYGCVFQVSLLWLLLCLLLNACFIC